MTTTLPANAPRTTPRPAADLRRTGINPDYWHPAAESASVPKDKTYAARFAARAGRAAAVVAGGAGRRREDDLAELAGVAGW